MLKKLCSVFVFVCVCSVFVWSGCEKTPDHTMKLLGPWKLSLGSVHSILTFRMNGSWSLNRKIEGRMLKIIESKKDIVGEWKFQTVVVPAKNNGTEETKEQLQLVMISNEDNPDAGWDKGVAVVFDVLELSETALTLQKESGRIFAYKKLRGEGSAVDEIASGITAIHMPPLCVNIKKNRSLSKSRYMCMDLSFLLDNTNGIAYVEGTPIKVEDKVVVNYYLHPRIREILILFLSDQAYNEIKTLEKVEEKVNEMKAIFQPYFNGSLTSIKVNKVVVTASLESVEAFRKMQSQPAQESVDVRENGE